MGFNYSYFLFERFSFVIFHVQDLHTRRYILKIVYSRRFEFMLLYNLNFEKLAKTTKIKFLNFTILLRLWD